MVAIGCSAPGLGAISPPKDEIRSDRFLQKLLSNYSAIRRVTRKKGVRKGLRPLRTPFFRDNPFHG